jgi:hypothetical protein
MQLCLQQRAQIAALTASLASRDALLAQAQQALANLQGEARGVAEQLREDASTIESACDTLHVVINE